MKNNFISIANTIFVIIKDNLTHRIDEWCLNVISNFQNEIYMEFSTGLYKMIFVSDKNKIGNLRKRSFIDILKDMKINGDMSDEMYIKLKKYFQI